MREIHEIRERIYEETKNMTQEERAALTRKEAQEMIDKYGLQVKRRIPLDDGVKANYPKFVAALKKIPGLGAKEE
ncbi:MAG: hypothetical protein LBM00_00020 [Deltaproteobacteria bacterium]|nr:hypothetical protein [Deltaproteobacteria bacterium]